MGAKFLKVDNVELLALVVGDDATISFLVGSCCLGEIGGEKCAKDSWDRFDFGEMG